VDSKGDTIQTGSRNRVAVNLNNETALLLANDKRGATFSRFYSPCV
jgi:hypothetical protein